MVHSVGRILVIVLLAAAPGALIAQVNCVSPDRIKTLKASIASDQNSQPDPKLAKELKALRSKHLGWMQKNAFDRSSLGESASALPDDSQKSISRICSILNSDPWPTIKTVGSEGAANWLYLIKNYFSFDAQIKLMPVIAEAIKSKAVEKDNDLASFIDRMRVRSGLGQLFGTQVTLRDGFLVLAPLQSESNIDKWRAQYALPPLRLCYIQKTMKLATR